MSDGLIERDALLLDTKQATARQRRRMAEVKAREHVGAAGWSQTAALDSILRLGQDGLLATESLRQVVRLTTEQIRSLPLATVETDSAEHVQILQDIVQTGEAQMTVAEALERLLCRALDEVSSTPLDTVSVTRLRSIYEWIQAQVAALNTIVQAAQVQAQTLEQVGELGKINAEHQQRVEELQQFCAQEEVNALGVAGETIVQRIATIDEAPPQQLQALRQIGEAIVDKVPDTGESVSAQAQALEELAEAAQQQAQVIRQGSDKTDSDKTGSDKI